MIQSYSKTVNQEDKPNLSISDDVPILSFSEGKHGQPVRLGGKLDGDIYVGRMRFSDGSIHTVAIKRFKSPPDTQTAKKYNAMLRDLWGKVSSIPKVEFAQLRKGTMFGDGDVGGEWV